MILSLFKGAGIGAAIGIGVTVFLYFIAWLLFV